MKSYLKLVHFEMERFFKLYLFLIAFISIVQIGTTIFLANYFMNMVKKEDTLQSGMEMAYGTFGVFDVTYTLFFIIPIAIGATSLLFYMFFIWYRDWFAGNTFIYRLLTLPTARMNVFFAKLTTIMVTVFGLVSLQFILLHVLHIIVKWIVPVTFRDDTPVIVNIRNSEYLHILFPSGFVEFFLTYGAGLAFVVVVFTMILFERSFRLKGILFSILYALGCVILLLIPFIVEYLLKLFYFYPGEIFVMELVLTLIVLVISLWISRHLIKHKITV